MRIQVFSEYLQLGQAGRVKPLACPMHLDEEAAFPLFHRLTDQDKVILECYACNYKNIAGQQLYENLIKLIEAENIEPKKVDENE